MITVTFTSHPPPPVTPKQIKPFSLPPSCLHFTLLTLHLHLSLSSQTPLFPDSQQAVIYMQILICDFKKKKLFFLSQNKHCLRSCLAFSLLYQIQFYWLDMASRESSACCLQSRVKRWWGQEAHGGSWWETGQCRLCQGGPLQWRE